MGDPRGMGCVASMVLAGLGGIFCLGGLALLVFNEQDAVADTATLAAARAALVPGDPARLDPALEGKFVHLTGRAEAEKPLVDEEYGLTVPALTLARQMRVYQWRETKSTHTRKVGKSRRTVTTYSHAEVWAEHPIDSSRFHEPEGHQNPPSEPMRSADWTVPEARLGRYRLDPAQLQKLGSARPYPIPAETYAAMPGAVRARFRLADGVLYQGADPGRPQLGDVKVEYLVRDPQPVSVLGCVAGEGLVPFTAGRGDPVFVLEPGTRTASELLDTLQTSQTVAIWVFRCGSWLLLFFGIMLATAPLTVLAGWIPFLGPLVGLGAFLAAFVGASVTCLGGMALFWFAASPVFAAALLGGALTLGLGAVAWGATRAPGPAPAPAPSPPTGS